MNYIKIASITLLLLMFNFIPANAQILNGDFSYVGGIEYWTPITSGNASIVEADIVGVGYTSGQAPAMIVRVVCDTDQQYGTAEAYQTVDVTGFSKLAFYAQTTISSGGSTASIGSTTHQFTDSSGAWIYYELNIVGTGNQTVSFYSSNSESGAAVIVVDHIYLIPIPTLYGYVTDAEGDPMLAYLYLNDSSDPIYSDDVTGYYEFTNLDLASYLITATSPTQQDYTDTVTVSGHTEHNISMVRLLPDLLSGPSIIHEGATSIRIGWTENSVVDSVKIYQGTNTNLIYTMDTTYTYTNSYTVTGLNYETPYTFWVQPLDGVIAGTKYEITGTTSTWDVSIPPPVGTTTPTPTLPIEDDNETLITDLIEIITELLPEPLKELPEKVLELVEETITYISTPFNWILLITAYIGAFIGKSIFNEDEDYTELITSTLLLGTIGWIIILLINFFVPIISQNEVISILIFTTSGFIIAAIASSTQPETEKRTPRRPRR